jgi:hypothetical protein
MKSFIILAAIVLANTCGTDGTKPEVTAAQAETNISAADPGSGGGAVEPAHGSAPRTIRDHFMQLPAKYFTLEGCEPATDKGCQRAKLEYLKTFAEIEDTKNGYLKAGCDGAQACIEMAIFKRPDGSYIAGVATFAEMMNDFYFLDPANDWADVSKDIVVRYRKSQWYELPRIGTTMKVYSKKVIEKTDEFEITEKGDLLYSLDWKDGKFQLQN